jgi:hypothetical protein
MVEAIEQQSGQRPKEILADSGYCSEGTLVYLESDGLCGTCLLCNSFRQ